MGIIDSLTTFKNKIKELRNAQAIVNGGRNTPIYINLGSFALNLGRTYNGTWNWNSVSDMKEFMEHYVPVMNDLNVKLCSYLAISTIDIGQRTGDTNTLTIVAEQLPAETTHTFSGSTYTYDFREICLVNAELQWLPIIQGDDFGLTRSNNANLTSYINHNNVNSWSRVEHEVGRQKLAGYYDAANPAHNFSTAFKNALTGYVWNDGDARTKVEAALAVATTDDVRQIVILMWRDCVNYLRGNAIMGSNNANIQLASRAYGKLIHDAGGVVGSISGATGIPTAEARGSKPTQITTEADRFDRNTSNVSVYYNKKFNTVTTLDVDQGGNTFFYSNNDLGLYNISYIADQAGEPTNNYRLYRNPAQPLTTVDRNIYGYEKCPKVGGIKHYIAAQSNADSYGTALYLFHACGSEYKELIESGVKFDSTNTSTGSVQLAQTSSFTSTYNGTTVGSIGSFSSVGTLNSVCNAPQIQAGHTISYDDLQYWISSTLSTYCGHLRKQISRNLEYNKAYLTGISDINLSSQTTEIQNLSKKPICIIVSSTPSNQTGVNVYSRLHYFKTWPADPSEYVKVAISSLFGNGDKNISLVEKPDEIMFWNASRYYDITSPQVAYGNTFRVNLGETNPNGFAYWNILASRVGLEKLVLGRSKVTESEKCAINYKTSSVSLGSNSSNQESFKWCFENQLGDAFWATPSKVWWSPTTGTDAAILSAGLLELDDELHPLYPFLKGTALGTSVDRYQSNITTSIIMEAITRFQSYYVLRVLEETRNQLDTIGA